MKICPRCQKTYTDDNLNFCLEDGNVLEPGNPIADLETVRINQTRMTQPPAQATTGAQWGAAQPYTAQPKKSSKAWVWVLLILGGVALLCGGGLLGLLAYIGSKPGVANSNPAGVRANQNTAKRSPTPGSDTATASDRDDVTEIDLEIFVREFSLYGTTAINGGELIMASKKKGFYYVLVAPEEYQTEKADTRVTLRNIDDASGSLGYGLIFHSNPIPLQQGYAFLIDTKKKKYRVVNHSPSKESPVITWTNATAIRGGSEENTLEVRDLDDKIDLYINGTMVNSIRNVYGYPKGVAGLYAGDGVKVAFKDLEIRK